MGVDAAGLPAGPEGDALSGESSVLEGSPAFCG